MLSDNGPWPHDDLEFVGHRMLDGLAMASVVPISSVLAAEGRGGTFEIQRAGSLVQVAVRTLEDAGVARRKWSSDDVPEVWEKLGAPGERGLIPYSASAALVSGRRIYAAVSDLKSRLDSKRWTRRLFEANGIAHARGVHGSATDLVRRVRSSQLTYPLVVRPDSGSSGSGVFKAADEAALLQWSTHQAQRTSTATFLADEFVTGQSLNVTGIAFKDGVVVYRPSIQLIGQPACTELEFGFCGSDYVAMDCVDIAAQDAAMSMCREVGAALLTRGWRGLFGIDCLAEGYSVVACEVNPRFQSSTALLNFACTDHAEYSPGRLHMASCKEASVPVGAKQFAQRFEVPFSLVLVYSRGAMLQKSLLDGEYSLKAASLIRVSGNVDPNRMGSRTFSVSGGLGSSGSIPSGVAVGRLVVRGRALNGELGALTSDITRATSLVRHTQASDRVGIQ